MVTFTLSRSEAYFIANSWLLYMVHLSQTRMINHAGSDGRYLNAMAMHSQLDHVLLTFNKKLVNRKPTTFKFTFDYHYAIAFYYYIFTHPIQNTSVWENQLRQRLCDELHQQLFAMRPPVHQNIPLTIEDYYADYL